MSNEIRNKVDVAVEKADKVYDAAVERTVDRMKQAEENYEKDKDTAKKVVEAAVEASEVVVESVVNQIVKLLNGEKVELKNQRAHVIEVIDRVVEKADVYYELITERVMERVGQFEENVDKDIETAKNVKNELNSNS